MYDENELYEELKKTVTTVGQDIYKIIDQLNRLSSNAIESSVPTATEYKAGTVNNDFVFTGQSTDLRYFAHSETMPVSMIENIHDESLKYAVKDEFNKASLSGKIEIDNQKGIISITEKGREFINRPEFKKAAAENISNMTIQKSQTMEFALNGTVQDLNFFNHADELNLADIVASPNKEAVQNVLSNLQKMKESGLISVSDSVVKITDKGKNILNNDLFKLASKSAAKGAANTAVEGAVGAVGSVPGVIVVAVKKATEVSLKAASSLIKK